MRKLGDYLDGAPPMPAPAPAEAVRMRVDTRTGEFTPILPNEDVAPGPFEIIVGFGPNNAYKIVARGARVTSKAIERLKTMKPAPHPNAKLPKGVAV